MSTKLFDDARACPTCHVRTDVTDTRIGLAGTIRRVRRCPSCQHRYRTYEVPDSYPRLRALIASLGLGRDASS